MIDKGGTRERGERKRLPVGKLDYLVPAYAARNGHIYRILYNILLIHA